MRAIDSQRPLVARTRSRISYNAAIRFVGRTLGGLISLAALHLATHYFNPTGWGSIAAALAFVGLFSSLADFGVSSVLARDLVTSGEPEVLFGSGLLTALVLSLFITALAAAVGALAFMSLSTTRVLTFLLLPTIPASALFAAISSVFIARSRNDIRAVFDVLSSLLPLAGVVAIVELGTGQDSYGILLAAASLLTAALGVPAARRYLQPRLAASLAGMKALAREAWPLGASQLTGAIYLQIDVLLVVAFLSTRQVGLYGLASQIAGFFASVPAMVTVAATPAFMRKDDGERRRLAARLFRVLAAGALVTVLIGLFLSRFVLEIVGGSGFSAAADALMLLLAAAGISFLVSTFSAVIYFTGNQRYLARIGVSVLLANVVANLVAIPLWGMNGAAAALVLSELVALGSSVSVARSLGFSPKALLGL